MNREPQPSVCQFCGAEIKLTDDEWAIQSPYGTLPGHVCAECAPDTVSGANRKKGYMMFVSRRAVKPNKHNKENNMNADNVHVYLQEAFEATERMVNDPATETGPRTEAFVIQTLLCKVMNAIKPAPRISVDQEIAFIRNTLAPSFCKHIERSFATQKDN